MPGSTPCAAAEFRRPTSRVPDDNDPADAAAPRPGHRCRRVVIGAGHNGLVAANLLADAGWNVARRRASDRAGGAIRSDESLHPGFVTDWFSAFYPLAAASPVLQRLDLDRLGAAPGGTLRPSSRTSSRTAAAPCCPATSPRPPRRSTTFGPATAPRGRRWWPTTSGSANRCCARSSARSRRCAPALRLARTLGTADLLRFARFAVQPVRRLGDETFSGEGAPLLFAGNALHTDLPPEAPGSAIYGWLLCMLGQTVGFPVPVGGSSAIPDALVARFEAGGRCVAAHVPGRVRRSNLGRTGDRRSARVGERIAARWPCSPTSARRTCTGISSARSTCRRDWSTTSTTSSGTPDAEGELGAVPPDPVDGDRCPRRRHRPSRRRPERADPLRRALAAQEHPAATRSCCSGR